jgi:hypothetical protein
MKMLAWMLCLAVLVTAVTSEEPSLSANGDDFIMIAPGTLYLNGKNVVEYLGKIDDLVSLVAIVMQENKEIKVRCFCLRRVNHMPHRWRTQR